MFYNDIFNYNLLFISTFITKKKSSLFNNTYFFALFVQINYQEFFICQQNL